MTTVSLLSLFLYFQVNSIQRTGMSSRFTSQTCIFLQKYMCLPSNKRWLLLLKIFRIRNKADWRVHIVLHMPHRFFIICNLSLRKSSQSLKVSFMTDIPSTAIKACNRTKSITVIGPLKSLY